jgi:xylulokinase
VAGIQLGLLLHKPLAQLVATPSLSLFSQIWHSLHFLLEGPDSASLGAALRAAHGWLCSRSSADNRRPHVPPIPFSDVLRHGGDASAACLKMIRSPRTDVYEKYGHQVKVRSALEGRLVAESSKRTGVI